MKPGAVAVDSIEDSRALASAIRDPSRTRPIAVISIPAGRTRSYIDADEIADTVGDVVVVYVIASGEVSWEFSHHMAEMTQVYGGAGRVYPVGLDWERDPYLSPLRFAFNATEASRSTDDLIMDAIKCARDAGLIGQAEPKQARVVSGKVISFVAGRALVRLETGAFANVVGELTVPGVPVERVLRVGLRVNGTVDDAGRLDVRRMIRSPSALPYEIGDVVLARVARVTAAAARLELYPGLNIDVTRDEVTANELDELDSLMTVDEVLRARLIGTAPWAVWLRDLDDDELAVAASSLVDGGPPWLVEGLPVSEPDEGIPAAPSPTDSPTVVTIPPSPVAPVAATRSPSPAMFDRTRGAEAATPVEAPPRLRESTPSLAAAQAQADLNRAHDELRALRDETRGLREETRLLDEQRVRALNDAKRARDELARSRKKLRNRGDAASEGGRWFSDDEVQFRFEVTLAWAQRVPAAEKDDLPLRDYELGPKFLLTVAALEGISRAKIVEVTVEVLTGLVERIGGRELHQLRTGEGGNARPAVRDDGATCWRVSLQVKTAGARRLHYWMRPNGSIELSRVAVHDDYTP